MERKSKFGGFKLESPFSKKEVTDPDGRMTPAAYKAFLAEKKSIEKAEARKKAIQEKFAQGEF